MAETRRAVNIYINGREINNTLKSIAAEKRKVSNELERMTMGTDEYENKVRELQKLNGLIREHHDRVRTVEDAWGKVKAGASTVINYVAGYLAADVIIAYGKKLFDLGAQMELLSQKARTVFGEALPSITREAQANATAMGLTTSEYINAAAAIGDLLIPMGFQRKEAADISAQLVNLSGALSEWTGGQITAQEVSDKLANALLGEREELKALGISISQADVDARLAAEGLDKLTGSALEQAQAQATLNIIMEKSIDAQTAYAGNSDMVGRRQAELLAKFQQLQENLAVLLMPAMERLLSLAIDLGEFFGVLSSNIDANSSANERAIQSVMTLKEQFNLEMETIKRGNISKESRKKLIDEINGKYAQYLPNLIQETDNLNQITSAQDQANKAFQERITLMAFEKQMGELQQRQVEAKTRELDLQVELTKAQQKFDEANKRSLTTTQITTGLQNTGYTEANIKLTKIKNQIEANAKEQERLNKETEKYQVLAGKMGVSLSGATPTEGGKNQGESEAERERQRLAEQAAEQARQRAQAQAKSEADEIEKHQKHIQQILEKYKVENQMAKLSEDEQKIERLRIEFDKEIALVKELEAKKVKGATEQRIELERYKQQAIDALADELLEAQLKKEEEDRVKLQEAQDQAALKRIQDKLAMEQNLQSMVNDFVLSEQEKELLQLQTHYQEMLALAEKLGVDTTAITLKYDEEKKSIQKKFAEEQAKATSEQIDKQIAEQERQLQQAQQAFSAIGNAMSDVIFAFAGDSKVAAEFQKGITLAQIGFDTAKAISGITAAAASTSLTPFDFAIKVATGIATVLTNIAKAKQLLTQKIPDAPQRYTGGYYNVIGERDGKTYNARYLGRPGTGMLPGTPSLVLASEKGAEYFVANEDLRNPKVMNYVRAIENIRMDRVNQFATGGATVDNAISPAPTAFDARGLALLQEISTKLDTMYARVDDQTVVEIWRRYKKINESSGFTL